MQKSFESLFDELDAAKIKAFKLWKPAKNLVIDKNKIEIENILQKRSKKTGQWKQKYCCIHEGKLLQFNSKQDRKIKKYLELENVRFEKIKYEDKNDQNSLLYGFRLRSNNKYSELYPEKKEILQDWVSIFKKFCVLTTFQYDYSTIKLLGKGNFAKVYYSRNKLTGQEYAVKAFDKEKFQSIEVDRPALIKEIAILRLMDHKGVIKMFEVYENENYIFLVKELLRGGELFHKLKGQGNYNEEYAAKLMKNLLSALAYINSKNVLHRDLKPENLILRSNHDDYDICIADFGLADFYNPTGNYMFKRCGTPGYVAPEVLADKIYDFKVDSFSAGVIMFIILTGAPPFKGKSYDEIVLKNYNCTIDFQYKDMHKKLSPEAYDLLKKLLEKDPKIRMSAAEALNHNWFNTINKNEQAKPNSGSLQINEDMPIIEKPANADLKTKTPLMNHKIETPIANQLKYSPISKTPEQSYKSPLNKGDMKSLKNKMDNIQEYDDEENIDGENNIQENSQISENMQNLQRYDFSKKIPSKNKDSNENEENKDEDDDKKNSEKINTKAKVVRNQLLGFDKK